MKTTRRQFIKISSLGAGGLAAGAAFAPLSKASDLIATLGMANEPLSRTPTYCEVCFWQCAGWVYKDSKGEIQKSLATTTTLIATAVFARVAPAAWGSITMPTA